MNGSELRKISRDLRNYSSRLLKTNNDAGLDDTRRLLNLIDKTPILKDYVESCVRNYTVDIKEIREQMEYRDKYPLPLESDDEVAFTYQLLKYGVDNFGGYMGYSFKGYSNGSRKYQDHIDAFNDEVVRHFVNHLTNYLQDYREEVDEETLNVDEKPKCFISYCWNDVDVVNMVDIDFKDLFGIVLTRDERDLEFKESIKKFMQSLNEHDYVIMVISDSYLKSNNCMYEVMEVMRDRKYTNKVFWVILNENDKKYYENKSLIKIEEQGRTVECNIYDLTSKIGYSKYWQEKFNNINSQLLGLDGLDAYPYYVELKQIRNIKENISEFISTITDLKNESLDELKSTNYKSIAKKMKLNKIIK